MILLLMKGGIFSFLQQVGCCFPHLAYRGLLDTVKITKEEVM